MTPTSLQIKVKALQRLIKEETYYKQELKEQTEHVEKLKNDSEVDPYDLKKQIEVQQDTERLLPSLYKKIEQFKENLNEYMESYEGTEDLTEAKEIVIKANELLSTKISA
ncbi:hypothetical protein TBLA_0B03610 [Henningerozyma blattae CBS 6284]|uniref:Tubulin-specific chaperone A n=1 Tax=Henningerozyma blattae (strain ATCC 34711 / CBS 6284 / DSM 70876 / NBRC 10599 / NRRL Y-10934 / UCD 77-7) TaxID=1071380 RepID=I2GYJ9_HENB6|nr:hypothetical protein TBLA_0B03610 [Tetrapisispora blattae CBS 6284]CCH59201.1 hypothetical protein TBLA_0B03610 [Tetrapisispora blattae CBS 6284]